MNKRKSPISTDLLTYTVRKFIEWRNDKDYRKEVKTRAQRSDSIADTIDANRIGNKYYCSQFPFRDVGDADEVARKEGNSRAIDHNGYYCDSYQHNLAKGKVLQLPSKKGVKRYLACTYMTEVEGCIVVYVDRHYDDAMECARIADRYAELLAETARDDDARYQAQQQIEDAKDTIKQSRKSVKDIIKELRELKKYELRKIQPVLAVIEDEDKTPSLCESFPTLIATAKKRIEDILCEKTSAIKLIKRLELDYWLAVDNYS